MFNEAARLVRGGGRVLIKDLRRQPAWKIPLLLAFSKYVLGYTDQQLTLYRESLQAALSLGEVREALTHSMLSMANVQTFRGVDFLITA